MDVFAKEPERNLECEYKLLQANCWMTDKVTDVFAKELERNLEFEDKLDQADCWIGKRNKVFRKIMYWFLAEDRFREA